MSELPAEPISVANPLAEVHRQAEAEFQQYGSYEIVSTFGEPQAEYAAIRKSAGLIDFSQRGVLKLTGKDRLTFLNQLLTNQTFDKQTKTGLPSDKSVYAFLLNNKTGRILADMRVIEQGEFTLVETDGRLTDAVAKELDRYIFSEQVKIANASAEYHQIGLHGPTAANVIGAALSQSDWTLPVDGVAHVSLFGSDAIIWRDDVAGAPGFGLLVPSARAREVWMNFLSRFGQPSQTGKRDVRPVGWAAFNATRIEGGRPLFGIDFDDTMLPAETSLLNRAVSFTKGCYPGQEVVARMHARNQFAKSVVGLRFSDDKLPMAGSPVYDESENVVGGITSSTVSPVLSNTAIALAIVKKPLYEVGKVLRAPAEGAMRNCVVTELPFVK